MSVNPTSPKLVVTSGLAFWRTSELNEAAQVSEQLTEARKAAEADLVVSGSFFQETRKTKLVGLLKKAGAILAPAAAATGLLVAGLTAGPALLVAGALGVVTAIAATSQTPLIKKDLEDYQLARKYQEFEGLNVWRDGAPPTEINVETTSGPDAGLRELLYSNMRDYPQSLHVVHANGHGMGARYSAGMPTRQLAEALDAACEKSGNDVDVAVLDTCFGSSFETLSRLAKKPGHVKYVVAFEDAIPNGNSEGGRIPLDDMIASSLSKASAKDVAVAVAEVAGEHFDKPNNKAISEVPLLDRLNPSTLEQRRQGMDSTVAAIDLEALRTKLHPTLDKAGLELKQALRDPALAAAVAEAKKASEIEYNHDLVDLGGFLSRVLEKAPKGSPLEATLKDALKGLEDSLMFKRTGHKFALSGLSFHTRERAGQSREISPAASAPLEGDHLPQRWIEFVKDAF